jgi:hypothetical protein
MNPLRGVSPEIFVEKNILWYLFRDVALTSSYFNGTPSKKLRRSETLVAQAITHALLELRRSETFHNKNPSTIPEVRQNNQPST